MVTTSDQPRQPEPTDRRRLITCTITTLLLFVLCLFLPAGPWSWARGWLSFAVVVASLVVVSLHLRRANPDVLAALNAAATLAPSGRNRWKNNPGDALPSLKHFPARCP